MAGDSVDHHWVRVAAGTEDYDSSRLANTVPPGDRGFWFYLDANNDDVFNFYVYWYKMRSGRCDDGTAVPGCEGDQRTTYYYGNSFRPPEQTPFAKDTWFCVEMMGKANAVGQSASTEAHCREPEWRARNPTPVAWTFLTCGVRCPFR